MEVNPNIRVAAANEISGQTPVKLAPPVPADQAAFAGSNAVNNALQQAPDVRAGKVEQAQQLVNDPQYPPLAMINAISRLLATGIPQGQ